MEMDKLAAAVIAVMKDVRGMEKSSKVGQGRASYNGTKDSDVKEVFNDAMAKHGLCMIPQDIHEDTKIDSWDETTQFGTKRKQSVFTRVKVDYLLLHKSGQSMRVAGYGHGVDPQDKAAGKATTYAMKNALLYTFMTPVGKIDDTETTHSNDIPVPGTEAPKPAKQEKPAPSKPVKKRVAKEEAGGLTKAATLKAIKEAKSKDDLTKIKTAIVAYGLTKEALEASEKIHGGK